MLIVSRITNGVRIAGSTTPAENQRHKPNIKLSMEKARQIRKMDEDGVSQADIARFFDVSPACIWSVLENLTWNEMPEQAGLGHENINNTIKYLSFKEDDLIEAIQAVFGDEE